MKLKNDIATSESGFIFNPLSGESFTTNPIGFQILKLLKEGKEESEIHAALLDEYEIDAATLEKDFDDFINMLHQYNLLEK